MQIVQRNEHGCVSILSVDSNVRSSSKLTETVLFTSQNLNKNAYCSTTGPRIRQYTIADRWIEIALLRWQLTLLVVLIVVISTTGGVELVEPFNETGLPLLVCQFLGVVPLVLLWWLLG